MNILKPFMQENNMGLGDLDITTSKIFKILENLEIYDVVTDVLGRGNRKGQLRKKKYLLCFMPFS